MFHRSSFWKYESKTIPVFIGPDKTLGLYDLVSPFLYAGGYEVMNRQQLVLFFISLDRFEFKRR
jgi:hypothetical protein